MRGVIVEVSSRKFGVPFECPCCGAAPETDMRVTRGRTGRALTFRTASGASRTSRRGTSAGVASAGVAVLGIVARIALAVHVSVRFGAVVFLVCGRRSLVLRLAGKTAAEATRVVHRVRRRARARYLGWSGRRARSRSSRRRSPRGSPSRTRLLANDQPAAAQAPRRLSQGAARRPDACRRRRCRAAPADRARLDGAYREHRGQGRSPRRARTRARDDRRTPTTARAVQTVARLELAPLLDKLQRSSSPAAKKATARDRDSSSCATTTFPTSSRPPAAEAARSAHSPSWLTSYQLMPTRGAHAVVAVGVGHEEEVDRRLDAADASASSRRPRSCATAPADRASGSRRRRAGSCC